jgi:hypothetical protein
VSPTSYDGDVESMRTTIATAINSGKWFEMIKSW